MIYLAQLQLNPNSRQVQAEVRNPYEMHRTLARAIPAQGEQFNDARLQFRLEESDNGQQINVLVQSLLQPKWDVLVNRTNYLLESVAEKTLQPTFKAGQTFRFRLRANPTKRVKDDNERDKLAGKRVQLFKDEEQLAWLRRKGEAAGFYLLSCQINSNERQLSRKGNGEQSIVHQAVLFEGLMRAVDPTALLEALSNGIGSGKGFGFGLLSLARR